MWRLCSKIYFIGNSFWKFYEVRSKRGELNSFGKWSSRVLPLMLYWSLAWFPYFFSDFPWPYCAGVVLRPTTVASGGWLRAQMHQFCWHQTSFFMKLCSLTPGQLSRCAMYIQAFHWKLSLSLKASYVLAVSKANNLDMFGATICTKVEKFRQTYHFIIMYILHYENKFTKLI